MKNILFDIEADGLLDTISKIHCVSFYDLDTEVVITFTGDNSDDIIHVFNSAETLVGHNITGYDLHVLERFYGLNLIDNKEIFDTWIMSQLFKPDRQLPFGCPSRIMNPVTGKTDSVGPHSLLAWSYKVDGKKPIIYDWRDQLIEVYIDRCEEDVKTNAKVFKYLMKEYNSKWKEALDLKQKTRYLMTKQEIVGVWFDEDYAIEIWDKINNEMIKLENEVNPLLPIKKISPSRLHYPPVNQFKMDGSYSKHLLNYLEKYGLSPENVELPLTDPIITEEPMTISNQADMKDWLLGQGWVPTLWNFKKNSRGKKERDEQGRLIKTSPKMQENGRLCPNLEKLSGSLAKKVVKYLSLRNRRAVLSNPEKNTGWLQHPRLKKDNRLPAGSSGITNTGRQKHSVVANVPKARKKVLYGTEFRDMFKATPGYTYCGWDASQLEARVEAHYTYPFDDGEYADKLICGNKEDGTDIHTQNSILWHVDYDTAKNGKYALTYGCTPPKLAETLGKPKKDAQVFYDAFWGNNKSLRQLRDSIVGEWRRNGMSWIANIDGGKLYSRSEHSLMNLRFQSTGATIMDLAGVIIDGWVEILNMRFPMADVRRVIYYHDEYIFEYKTSMGERFGKRLGEMGVESIREAGRRLGMNIPLDGEYKLGNSWAEVH